jgi:polyisoprenoid-binding protein YceI
MSSSQHSSDLAPDELRQLLQKGERLVLMNVLTPEAHTEAHLPGSVNFCVYETAFIGEVTAAFPDRTIPFVVYGLGDATIEAQAAQEQLAAAGYLKTRSLAGGLRAWQIAGGPVEGNGAPPPPSVDGDYVVDTAASMIFWTGQNLLNFHQGRLHLAGGELAVQRGKVVSGRAVIDMTSLGCFDLTDSALNRALLGHLQSEDFFSVDRFPTAEFVFERVVTLPDTTPGSPNYRVAGSLTLRGVTAPVEFAAVIGPRPEGGQIAQAQLDFDRTRWGALYGSGRFFARLGGHLVNDLVHLHLKILTKPKGG